MRRYEDYSCCCRYLPLVNWMTKTLGRIIEKVISSPDISCRNEQIEIKLLNITHTWCSSVLARSLNKAIRQKQTLFSMSIGKRLLNFTFLVSTNASWFHSYLGISSVYHRMHKSCFNSHRQKKFFCKSCSPVIKFPRNVFLFQSQNNGSCDPE